MRRHLRLVQPGEKVPKQKPHFNLRTLQRKAASALHHIAASGYETHQYPRLWVRYLRRVSDRLQDEGSPPPLHEMAEVELDIEAIEAGMIHMNITTRPVEVLFLPRALLPEMVDRLSQLGHKLKGPPIPMEELPPENFYNLLPLRQRISN